MGAIKDDYDNYIKHISTQPNKEIRADTLKIIKWTMVKRSIIRIAEIAIIGLTALGIVPNFF